MESGNKFGSGLLDFLVGALVVTLYYLFVVAIFKSAWYLFKMLFGWALPKRKVFDRTYKSDMEAELYGSDRQEDSISSRYERAISGTPDPSSAESISRYQDLMSGKILDRDLVHIPGEFLKGSQDRNPDYLKYLQVQKRLFQSKGLDASWLDSEIARLGAKGQIEEARLECRSLLVSKYGMPEEYVDQAITATRLTGFKPAQWAALSSEVCESMDQGYHEVAIRAVLAADEEEFSVSKVRLLSHLVDLDLPPSVAL